MSAPRPLRDADGEKITSGPVFAYSATQRLAVTAVSAASAAVGADTTMVRLTASTFMYVVTGAAPTATNAGLAVQPGESVVIPIAPGGKVAAIRESADGALSIAELA
jgi:hypothetical protein